MNEWNDIAVLTPPGDIDIASVSVLRRRLDNLIDRGVRRVVINCQAVGFIDSTGLAFLLTRARELMRREGLLSLVNASDEVIRFLEIARLVDILHVAGPARESIPAIPVGELPRWGKSIEVQRGIENRPYYRHRVAELLEGSAANIVNIVVVHEEQCEVKSMRTDVDQRTAALFFFI